MSAELRFASVLIVLLIVSSCSKSEDSVRSVIGKVPPLSGPDRLDPNPAPVENPKAACIPQKDLLSSSSDAFAQNGIVGGERIYQNEPDSTRVVILLNTEGSICTAAPIARDVLLTAAHCAQSKAGKYIVGFYTSISCESGFDAKNPDITAKVNELVVNESYIDSAPPSQFVGDLALVFLNKDIPANYPIYKLAIPENLTPKNNLFFFGYGAIGFSKKNSGVLRKTELFSEEYEVKRAARKVVINQQRGHGVCSGDSGGPGLVELDGELQILGVNSYVSSVETNDDACKGNATLVLTDSYRDWIEVKMAARNRFLRK